MPLLKMTTLVLIPTLIVQGYQVKKNTLRLPEPEGPRQGRTGDGQALSILILGDSAAAGVGVSHQDDALLGSVIAELQNDYNITWNLQAKTGDGSNQILQAVKQLETASYDVIITSIGVNDIVKLMSPKVWIAKQRQIYCMLHHKFNPKLIIAAGVPPMDTFPALPNPLGWLFGQYAKKMNQKLSELVQQQHHMQWIEYDLEQYKAQNLSMASDGFHPSKEIYQFWAKDIAAKIRKHFK